jgi:hypothetical protein
VLEACIAAHKESGLQQGGKFAIVQMDVSKKDQVATLWDKVPQDLRNVDILGMLEFEALPPDPHSQCCSEQCGLCARP